MIRSWSLALALAVLSFAGCPDATKVAVKCVEADLVAQCPAGSNPVLGSAADAACGASFDLHVVTEEGSATGQCSSSGSCNFLCQYASPCTCGVATLSKEQIVCAECQDQSCGDGRCEGTERKTCAAGATACMECPEDCSGANCGDGDCTNPESAQSCPQDCSDECTPLEKLCVGPNVQICSADGHSKTTFDCLGAGLICGGGECVAPGVCGNKACEAGESPAACPQDCGTLCAPASVTCEANRLATCNGLGTEKSYVDCGEANLICASGECRLPDVCGNQVCEAGESDDCPADCKAVCNNNICENGETTSCPQDCTTCGDHVCGAGELVDCPQDCGICVPSERFCLGELLRVCNANGTVYSDVDCRGFDQACVGGNCVEPDVCGNGACELGELEAGCLEDCAVVCGDDLCEGDETFTSCSEDCDPRCGDARCEGAETHDDCAGDCLASCGNQVCDAAEDRASCPRDCGFCGNGVCEDGAESGSLFPPATQVTCLVDCVVSGCTSDNDCDDGLGCTNGICGEGGVCHYQADDLLCAAREKCIKFSGCCADADGDGFAAIACGGSDCDDDDRLIFPGALEPCGGGDRNCNGVHRPALKPATKVTATPSYKTFMHMVFDGTRYWAMWIGVPEDVPHIEIARVSTTGSLIGDITAIPQVAPLDIHPMGAWSPQSQRLGVVWQEVAVEHPHQSRGAFFTTVDASGVLATPFVPMPSWEYGGLLPITETTPTGMIWSDGNWYVASSAYANNEGNPYGWWRVGENDIAAPGWFNAPGARDLVAVGDQVIGLFRERLIKVTASSLESAPVGTTIVAPGSAGECRLTYDGDAFVHVCQANGSVYYNRLAANGAALSTTIVPSIDVAPRSSAVAPFGLTVGDSAKIGVLAQDSTGGLVFFVQNRDGSAVVAPGLVASGVDVRDPAVFWDGDGFQVFWLAKAGNIDQLYRSTISCE